MTSPYRCVFMGTPAFAVPSLSALAETESVTLVVTNPDRPAGRGRALSPPPVKVEAQSRGIPVFQPERIKVPESVARVTDEAPDLIVVVAYGHILPKTVLDIPKICCINVHASLLPKYRGAAPINWAVARGETATGVTIMRMDPGMDTGPMLHVREIPIGADDTAETLYPRLAELGAKALIEALGKLHAGTLVETPQDDAGATSAPMLAKEHGVVDWTRPATEIRNLVRGMAPWPGAAAVHQGRPLKILSAVLPPEGSSPPVAPEGVPGEIVGVGRGGILVACGLGTLLVTRLQPEGGKAMDAWAYAQGRRVAKGERLSP